VGLRAVTFEIEESSEDYTVSAELPGLGADDLELEVTRDALRVKVGEVKAAEQSDGEGRAEVEPDLGSERSTRWAGTSSRKIVFTEELDPETVTASLKHGVLKMRLPKRAATSARRVAIEKE
jgi:HSP20 family protein